MERNQTSRFKHFVFASLPVCAVLIMSSCSSYKHSHRLASIPEKDITVTNKVAVDMTVDLNRVLRARSNKHSSISDAKDEAYYKAIVDNQVHVLVDPIYRIETSGKFLIFGGKSTAEVIGYAGFYSNPRSLKEMEDQLAEEKIAKDKAALERAVKNYVALTKMDITSTETMEKSLTDGKSSPIVVAKTVKKTTPMDEYFKLVSRLKY